MKLNRIMWRNKKELLREYYHGTVLCPVNDHLHPENYRCTGSHKIVVHQGGSVHKKKKWYVLGCYKPNPGPRIISWMRYPDFERNIDEPMARAG